MRTIAVVTVGRSDFGIYLPVLRRIRDDPELSLHLIVAGAHLSPFHGATVAAIEMEGIEIADRVEMLVASDAAEAIGMSMGLGVLGFASALARARPDILLVLGDRFEMHAAALAALPLRIPVAHIAGGERSEGAFDESLRHSITKLSHIHFVSNLEAAKRVRQLGEDPARVIVTGLPSIDAIRETPLLTPEALEKAIGAPLHPAPLLVTFHPVTLEPEQASAQMDALLGALEEVGRPIVFTMPNADTANSAIRQRIVDFVSTHRSARVFEQLGAQAYFSLMAHAAAMVGNSSSGIIEAASFGLPVVNVGDRQRGRLRTTNVIDAPAERSAIVAAIARACAPDHRKRSRAIRNPYGDGHAADRIVSVLKRTELGRSLTMKVFHDMAEVA